MDQKIFISHATADYRLVDILIKFLGDIGIRKDDIFCTSVGATLESGKNFIEQIKDNVHDSRAVLFLLSERFFLSYFCLAELGAAWALNQNIIPIIVPPISTAEYNKTPLLAIQALTIGNDVFVKSIMTDFIRKRVIEDNQIVTQHPEIAQKFNDSIINELKFLRKDSDGFYVARLVDNVTRKLEFETQISCREFAPIVKPCTCREIRPVTFWKLNGLLDEGDHSNIVDDWIDFGQTKLASAKIRFKVGNNIKQDRSSRTFSSEIYYELP